MNFQEGLAMNDADEAIDVSLETDRLEQLLEVPAPAQPVVMIEYRNRGVPWWLRRVLGRARPAGGRRCATSNSVVDRYQAQASNAAYHRAKGGERPSG